ncbi:NADP-dependent 3-hydroxy acid dehydrogenase YdfG [Leifsonia sp. 563]|uniref:hypothetical protein n=1 Tax=Leifsonia sp. 563 TaxID=3156412 RepID=UPI0033965EC4
MGTIHGFSAARAGDGVRAATKWGLNGWYESLRKELLPDVRVTLIERGDVATELPTHAAVNEAYGQATVTADDTAEVIVFALWRPRPLAINEILLRRSTQA